MGTFVRLKIARDCLQILIVFAKQEANAALIRTGMVVS